jgi:tRNA (guanine-N7-)-methyltransferase
MSKSGQLQLSRTRTIPVPNEYILAMREECAAWCFDEEQAPLQKGKWRSDVFKVAEDTPLDLELGTGNGLHFAHKALHNPKRSIVGLELKYKPLIQSIRRALRNACKNARMVRYNAYILDEIFTANEIDDIFIFFPDPWEKSRHHKHRMIQDKSLQTFYHLQRPGSFLNFKTDSRDYFDWAMKHFARSSYQVLGHSYDLHNSEFVEGNFVTQFENLFLRQKLPIHYAKLQKA